MKIIMPEHKVTDIEIGDRFLNTTWTVCGLWWRERDTGGKLRTYVPVRCDCGEEARGRWDRLHTTDVNKAPWSTRCRKCSAGGKPRAMDSLWHNVAKSADEISQNKVNNLSGQYFGDLYVIRWLGTNKGAHSIYKCRCSCGRTETVTDTALKSYKVACSECINSISAGERLLKNKITKEFPNMIYQEQYIFEDLIGDSRPLRFDGALLSPIDKQPVMLFEFQGPQHYHPVDHFGGTAQFQRQQRYDQKKRDYCKAKGIKLVEIPYTDIDKLR